MWYKRKSFKETDDFGNDLKLSNYRNKSSSEWEAEIQFLIARDGPICNKKNGFGCGKSVKELISEEERVRKFTGKTKKSPIFQIDHINNDSNQRDSMNGDYCGNEQLLCTPCHVRKTSNHQALKKRQLFILNAKPSSAEMEKNIKSEPQWVKEVINHILNNKSICLSLARYGFPELSPVTTKRYVDKRLVSLDPEVDPLFEDGWGRCSSRLCNGIHLYLYGNAPVSEELNLREIEE